MMIKVSDLGELAGTRFLGELLRRQIEGVWLEGEKAVVDFSGFTVASHSFLDEAFGVLLQERGLDFLNQNLQVVNADSAIKALIRFVMQDRLSRATNSPLHP
jgi:STAS-like domain of unknown function (DUF4325)